MTEYSRWLYIHGKLSNREYSEIIIKKKKHRNFSTFTVRFAPHSPVALCEHIVSFLINMQVENNLIELTFTPKNA
jgi:hypothetical protein